MPTVPPLNIGKSAGFFSRVAGVFVLVFVLLVLVFVLVFVLLFRAMKVTPQVKPRAPGPEPNQLPCGGSNAVLNGFEQAG
jgi:hypothetical protein